ncbi:hypothetical protein M9979_05015 [Sphingomonas sp. RP10(2022)]|uniref:Uncharacterized protein n=1 Tax=Sphingomonas liriopis TaxID=2949094 RepID=A0A9X2HN74_9SPHN|nr:hypothetical protein [Sphingomonas liriopis]MCP3734236.1 hypothetical protein [Sphingomonas liriopis]
MTTATRRHPSRIARLAKSTLAASALAIVTFATVAPAYAQDVRAAQKSAAGYTFDVAIPPKFLAVVTDPTKAGYNTITGPTVIGGKTYNVSSTRIAWVDDQWNNNIDNGRFAFARGNQVEGAWFQSFDKTDPGFADFVTRMKAIAERSDKWYYVTLTYLTPQGATVTSDYLPQPSPLPTELHAGENAGGLKLRQRIVQLSNVTAPGAWFPGVRVPQDIAQVRQAMLDYGNQQRLNPRFRAANDAKVATNLDLSQPTRPASVVSKEGKAEPVYAQPDMKLDDRYNNAAQWFAEALAAGKGHIHQYPAGTWTDPKGIQVTMTEAWDRAKYFGITGDLDAYEIAAPGWAAGDMPWGWMKSDTHYRWYFGVDGTYPLIGYGAAQSADGKWHYVGLADRDVPKP